MSQAQRQCLRAVRAIAQYSGRYEGGGGAGESVVANYGREAADRS